MQHGAHTDSLAHTMWSVIGPAVDAQAAIGPKQAGGQRSRTQLSQCHAESTCKTYSEADTVVSTSAISYSN